MGGWFGRFSSRVPKSGEDGRFLCFCVKPRADRVPTAELCLRGSPKSMAAILPDLGGLAIRICVNGRPRRVSQRQRPPRGKTSLCSIRIARLSVSTWRLSSQPLKAVNKKQLIEKLEEDLAAEVSAIIQSLSYAARADIPKRRSESCAASHCNQP